MKIGIACNVFGPSGGMERYTLDITKGLLERGHTVEIFTRKVDRQTAQLFKIPVHACNLSLCPGKLRDYFFSRWLVKARLHHPVDVMIGCCRNTASDLAICGGTHIGFLQALNRTAKASDKLAIHIEKLFYQRAKIIMAHSNLMAKELNDLYDQSSDKLVTVYPPSSLERFRPCTREQKAALRNQYNFPADKKVFLFVSSSHDRKGFPLLRSFFETTELPVTLAVAGRPIPNGLRNIQYLGFHNDIEHLYQACDYSVLASLYEPFGLAAIESVLCGTPVVLADNIGCSELIPNSFKRIFTKNDITSLSSAISEILKISGTEQFVAPELAIQNHIQKVEEILPRCIC